MTLLAHHEIVALKRTRTCIGSFFLILSTIFVSTTTRARYTYQISRGQNLYSYSLSPSNHSLLSVDDEDDDSDDY